MWSQSTHSSSQIRLYSNSKTDFMKTAKIKNNRREHKCYNSITIVLTRIINVPNTFREGDFFHQDST